MAVTEAADDFIVALLQAEGSDDLTRAPSKDGGPVFGVYCWLLSAPDSVRMWANKVIPVIPLSRRMGSTALIP